MFLLVWFVFLFLVFGGVLRCLFFVVRCLLLFVLFVDCWCLLLLLFVVVVVVCCPLVLYVVFLFGCVLFVGVVCG